MNFRLRGNDKKRNPSGFTNPKVCINRTDFIWQYYTFVGMKRKLRFTPEGSGLLGLMILFAIVFQSAHSFEHLVKQFSEKKCHHSVHSHKTDVTHSHDALEKCFVCEFAFSSYTSPQNKSFEFQKTEAPTSYTVFYSKEITQKFRGSLFALRAPPSFIV